MRLKKDWCFRTQLILIVADIFHVVRGGLGGGLSIIVKVARVGRPL